MKIKNEIPACVQSTESARASKELKEITKSILQKVSAEKIICFGSTVRSISNKSCFMIQEEVEQAQINSYYILVVPAADEKLNDLTIQQCTEAYLKSIASVTVIVHRMDEINLALKNGSSFFTTIYKKGTLLHDSGKEFFTVPEPGTAVDQRIIKREKFWTQWFELSENFLIGARFYASEEKNNLAIFMLHQTLQHCYSGMLRVLTGYRTNSNGLRRLLKLIENSLPGSSFSSSKNTPEDARLTSLLLKGFSDARYNEKFNATNEEVATLIHRIEQILQSANLVCTKRIQNIKEGIIPYTI